MLLISIIDKHLKAKQKQLHDEYLLEISKQLFSARAENNRHVPYKVVANIAKPS